jgi:hypothetical protein
MTRPRINLLFNLMIVSVLTLGGCNTNEMPTPPDDTDAYGHGWISFDADGVEDYFSVTGNYKPSDQFAGDTASEGAGGFVKDTTLFSNDIQMLFAGYLQKQDSVNLTQYLLVIGLQDSLSTPQIGQYPFLKNNHSTGGRNLYLYFLRTDSTHFYEIFVPKSGRLNLTVFDQSALHVHGNFSGTLWGLPPDTSMTLNVTNGIFDLYLADKFFNY